MNKIKDNARRILPLVIIVLSIWQAVFASETKENIPDTFRNYKLTSMGDSGELFVDPSIRIEIQKKSDIPETQSILFDYKNTRYSVSYSTGPSEDPHFIFSSFIQGEWQEIGTIDGWRLYLSSTGYIYSESLTNTYFKERRKFMLKGYEIVEIRQPFLFVDIDCKINEQADIKLNADENSAIVASLPKGSRVKILVAEYYSHRGDVDSEHGMWFLVSTPLGLVGWIETEGGYLHFRPGRPLSCIRFMGD